MFHLPDEYGATYNHLLKEIGSNPKVSQSSLPLFWPMRGWQYQEGGWLVIGHSPNGCDVNGNKQDFTSAEKRLQRVEEARKLSEPEDKCPMTWLTDPVRYRRQSKFFPIMKELRLREASSVNAEKDWPSWFCYSNLLKVGHSSMADTPRVVSDEVDLLKQEVEAFRPRRILVLTNMKWFTPFAEQLGLTVKVQQGQGIVKGTAMQGQRRWVITQHPSRLPGGVTVPIFAAQVLEAFASLPK